MLPKDNETQTLAGSESRSSTAKAEQLKTCRCRAGGVKRFG